MMATKVPPSPSRQDVSRRRRRLGELLVEAGLLNDHQLNAALNEQRKWGGRLGRVLVDMGFLDEGTIVSLLGQQLGLHVADIDNMNIEPELTKILRLDLAERYGVFPLRTDRATKTLLVATSDPTNVDQLQELEFATGMKVLPAVAAASAIDRAIRRYYFGESIVATQVVRADPSNANETTFELDALMDLQSAPVSEPQAARASAPLSEPDLQRDIAALKEQVEALERVSASQVRAVRSLLEVLIHSGIVTRDEYLERLHLSD
jgi:type IV pilus assembly protein PilB